MKFKAYGVEEIEEIKQLRRLLIKYPEAVEAYRLSPRELEVYVWCERKMHGATSKELASDFKISVQNASAQLKKLYDKGHLMRAATCEKTGGAEFIYKKVKP